MVGGREFPFACTTRGDGDSMIVTDFARKTSSAFEPSRLKIPPPTVLLALALRSSFACWNDLTIGGLGFVAPGAGSGSSSMRGRFFSEGS